MELRLLDDRVLIRLEKPERCKHGLWIPDSARREPYELYQATVLRTGPGRLRMSDGERNRMEVKAGDRVLVYWSAIEMQDGTDVVSEKSIQAVLE